MTSPRETELKLEADTSIETSLAGRLSQILGAPHEGPTQLVSTYFDTRRQALRRRGITLRVRKEGERATQTLKRTGDGGTLSRSEWETAAAADTPDHRAFASKEARKMLKARGTLRPVFATDVTRTRWLVRKGASDVEVSLDRGEVRAGDAASPLAEVELELKSGTASDLFGLAKQLSAAGRFQLGLRSKAERGYALLDDTNEASVKAEPVRLRPKMPVGVAFQVIARSCLKHFRSNESALVRTRAVEPLHQARVAIRRLRSALSIFKNIVADDAYPDMRRGLKDLSTRLGEARDLDVLQTHFAQSSDLRGLPAGDDAARILREREAAYDRVLATLADPAFRLFMLDLAGWIETGAWTAQASDKGTVAAFVPPVMKKRSRGVLRKGERLDAATPSECHAVRIEAKKLRYAGEFFASLAAGKRARRTHRDYIDTLSTLQDHLGALNDLHTGRAIVEGHADEGGGPSAAAPPDPGGATSEEELVRVAARSIKAFARASTPLERRR